MKLRVVTPLSIFVDEDVDGLRAEDVGGSFGILPGHAPFLTALAISIVSWRTGQAERFCDVRGGVLRVTGSTIVAIATREAVTEDSLATLDAEVLARFRSDADDERTENTASVRLQLYTIRRMASLLGSVAGADEFR